MGLDMYLSKRTFVKNWDHTKPEERHKITIKKGGKKTDIKEERISEITEDILQWRKANAIHNWFETNVAEIENGREVFVGREKLTELLNTCEKVLKHSELVKGKITNGYSFDEKGKKVYELEDGEYIQDPSVAEELLPTQAGFFFGGTDYDQYYYNDIKETAESLKKLLEEDESGDFYYSANW